MAEAMLDRCLTIDWTGPLTKPAPAWTPPSPAEPTWPTFTLPPPECPLFVPLEDNPDECAYCDLHRLQHTEHARS